MLKKKPAVNKASVFFEIVGRDPRIDLSRYTVNVLGREIIDYEKLSREDPILYKEILAQETEQNRMPVKE